MTTYLLTEGPFDAALLEQLLLYDERQHVEIVPAGGIFSVKSLARSLVVRRSEPIAIVVDADTAILEAAQERQLSIHESVASVSGDIPVKVITAIPDIESLFFANVALLEHLLGQSVPASVMMTAQRSTHDALEELLSNHPSVRERKGLLPLLTDQDVHYLRQTTLMQELLAFLHQVEQTA